ncbi:MAG: hypothetical protein ABWK01_05015 [Infirmifilum sp.]
MALVTWQEWVRWKEYTEEDDEQQILLDLREQSSSRSTQDFLDTMKKYLEFLMIREVNAHIADPSRKPAKYTDAIRDMLTLVSSLRR